MTDKKNAVTEVIRFKCGNELFEQQEEAEKYAEELVVHDLIHKMLALMDSSGRSELEQIKKLIEAGHVIINPSILELEETK